MSCRELLDCVIVAVGSDGVSFLDLRLDGCLSAKITSSISRVLDHDAALSRSDVPVIRLNTISVSDNRIGGRMRSIVSEALRSASLGIIDAGKYVKSDRTGLVLYSGGIVTDGAVMCQTRVHAIIAVAA